jgi:hypothetical protein
MYKLFLRVSRLLCLCCCGWGALVGYAAETDPAVELQKALRIEFSTYGPSSRTR